MEFRRGQSLGWSNLVSSGLTGGSGLLGQVLGGSSLRLEGAGDQQLQRKRKLANVVFRAWAWVKPRSLFSQILQ